MMRVTFPKPPRLYLLVLPYFMATAAASTDNKAGTATTPLSTPKGNLSVHYQQARATSTQGIEGYAPILQGQQQVLFLQGSWYRQRPQDNISMGLGHRWALENGWGLGYNLFYDQLLPHAHHRVSMGVEGWWHTLSLSANGYLPLSGWRPLPSLIAYRHRPAQGFDVTLMGHLPAFPSLEGSLHYARLQGNALVKTQQQYALHSHPATWALGVRYTPIPLLTLHYRYRASQKQWSQHQVGLQLTYRFNSSLRGQCDPAQVSLLRSTHYRLLDQRVERQSTSMVLAYTDSVEPTKPEQLVLQKGPGTDQNQNQNQNQNQKQKKKQKKKQKQKQKQKPYLPTHQHDQQHTDDQTQQPTLEGQGWEQSGEPTNLQAEGSHSTSTPKGSDSQNNTSSSTPESAKLDTQDQDDGASDTANDTPPSLPSTPSPASDIKPEIAAAAMSSAEKLKQTSELQPYLPTHQHDQQHTDDQTQQPTLEGQGWEQSGEPTNLQAEGSHSTSTPKGSDSQNNTSSSTPESAKLDTQDQDDGASDTANDTPPSLPSTPSPASDIKPEIAAAAMSSAEKLKQTSELQPYLPTHQHDQQHTDDQTQQPTLEGQGWEQSGEPTNLQAEGSHSTSTPKGSDSQNNTSSSTPESAKLDTQDQDDGASDTANDTPPSLSSTPSPASDITLLQRCLQGTGDLEESEQTFNILIKKILDETITRPASPTTSPPHSDQEDS